MIVEISDEEMVMLLSCMENSIYLNATIKFDKGTKKLFTNEGLQIVLNMMLRFRRHLNDS
jgi:hypothetical protein